jgi:hypothetical protein
MVQRQFGREYLAAILAAVAVAGEHCGINGRVIVEAI